MKKSENINKIDQLTIEATVLYYWGTSSLLFDYWGALVMVSSVVEHMMYIIYKRNHN